MTVCALRLASMGREKFRPRPFNIGNAGAVGSCPVPNPNYHFNDAKKTKKFVGSLGGALQLFYLPSWSSKAFCAQQG